MGLHEEFDQETGEPRQNFHQLLDKAANESFTLPSENPTWTIGEGLYHLSLASRFVIAD